MFTAEMKDPNFKCAIMYQSVVKSSKQTPCLPGINKLNYSSSREQINSYIK